MAEERGHLSMLKLEIQLDEQKVLEDKKYELHCINNFEVTNVGVNHDLLMLFEEEVEDPLKI